MSLITIPGEAAEPATLAEVRTHLNLAADEEPDSHLASLLTAARQAAEEYTERLFTDAEYTLLLDGLTTRIDFPVAPVGEDFSVTYLDPAGEEQQLPVGTYRLYPHPDRPALIAAGALPEVLATPGSVRVRFKGGHGPNNPVKRNVVHAIMLTIGHLYANREDVVVGAPAVELPSGSKALLAGHRRDFEV